MLVMFDTEAHFCNNNITHFIYAYCIYIYIFLEIRMYVSKCCPLMNKKNHVQHLYIHTLKFFSNIVHKCKCYYQHFLTITKDERQNVFVIVVEYVIVQREEI